MDTRQGSFSGNRTYEDIVPSHDLTHEDKADILNIDVTGFKKEQIKVHIDNYGKLRISGERPVGENKWIRFRKEHQTPENCDTANIRARFEKGHVFITLPKVVVQPVLPPQDQAKQSTTTDKTAPESKLPGANQNGHSEKANGEKKEEKRTEPSTIEVPNKVEDKEADKSDMDSESTSDTEHHSEDSTKYPTEQQKLSTWLMTFKQKALESAYGSRKAICSTFSVIVISVGVGLIINSKLFQPTLGTSGGSTDLVALIAP